MGSGHSYPAHFTPICGSLMQTKDQKKSIIWGTPNNHNLRRGQDLEQDKQTAISLEFWKGYTNWYSRNGIIQLGEETIFLSISEGKTEIKVVVFQRLWCYEALRHIILKSRMTKRFITQPHYSLPISPTPSPVSVNCNPKTIHRDTKETIYLKNTLLRAPLMESPFAN